MRRTLLGMLVWLASAAASAHPLAPAMLELRETATHEYEVLWRTSATRAGRSDVAPQLPANCRHTGEPRAGLEQDAWVARWNLRCDGGLDGQRIGVRGLAESRIAVILRLQPLAGVAQQLVLDARTPGYEMKPAAPAVSVLPAYFSLGVGHLLFGFDHLLFVCGLFLLVRGLRALVITVTAFTLGHSLTLSLASLGLVRVHEGVMELGIALSLLWLACGLARPRDAAPSLLLSQPWLAAAGFGLLHGLGFAGALAQVGLPAGEIPLALFAFNLGIEAGQLALIAALLMLKMLTRQRRIADYVPAMHALPSYVIGVLAAYWCWERATALLA